MAPAPGAPDAVAARIAPVPLLVVHGDADRFFPVEHGRWLAHAAGTAATLWEEAGFGHAEGAATPALVDRIGAWARALGDAAGPQGEGDPGPVSARMPA